MLDIQFVRDHPDDVREAARRKRMTVDVEHLLDVDRRRRAVQSEVEEIRAAKNRLSKQIRSLSGDEKAAAIAEMKAAGSGEKELQAQLASLEEEQNLLALQLPNLPDPEVPDGISDDDNVEIRRWGELPSFDFEPRDHLELGQLHDIIDIKRGVRLAGARTYMLKGDGAMLHLALLRFAVDFIRARGFTPFIVPQLVRDEAMIGTGYFPGGEEQAYRCERDGLNLIGTSEVPVTSYHGEEILDHADLPLHFSGYSTCYRREAGAAGKDTKGLYRVHQFDKVEQVVVTRADPQASTVEHEAITTNAEELLQALGMPYRVVVVCTGEMGQAQMKKYDIETWMPSRAAYCETHSSSKFHDFQARRLRLRYRDENGTVRFCHTLNNTLAASPRLLIPLLELNQEADGSIRIPSALVPYVGKDRLVRP